MHASFKHILLILFLFLLGACTAPEKPDTGLFGKATHTGELYIYRVPPNEMKCKSQCNTTSTAGTSAENEGTKSLRKEYTMLHGKMDLRAYQGKDGKIIADTHVTETDLITINLNYAFIKYFQEKSFISNAKKEDRRKGEIAVVVSFDAGSVKHDSAVIFSSKGQTLGSSLSAHDWPILGPINVDGNDLKVRITMIELDSVENQRLKEFVRSAGTTIAQLQPSVAAIVKIAQPIINTIISLNGDDVIFDQRFALQRVPESTNMKDIHRMPLIYGKYVLLLQEDILRSDDVQKIAKTAVEPPALSNIRFGLDNNRLYRLYDYYTDRWGWNDDASSELANGVKRIDLAKIDDLSGCVTHKDETFYEDHKDAKDIRMQVLGYEHNRVANFEKWYCLEHALQAAYCEGLRGVKARDEPLRKPKTVTNPFTKEKGLRYSVCESDSFEKNNNELPINYPITVFPTANAVLQQYPLHTHLVLSIQEATTDSAPIHESVLQFEDYIEKQMQLAVENNVIDELGKQLVQIKQDNRKQKVLLKKVKAEKNKNEKLCLLFNAVKSHKDGDKDNQRLLSEAPLYNQIYKISGEVLTTPKELAEHLKKNCETKSDGQKNTNTCTCKQGVDELLQKPQVAGNSEATSKRTLKLTTPPMQGDDVTRVQKALIAAGFAIQGEEGIYDKNTVASVEAFQKEKNIKIDGEVGPETRKELDLK